MYGSIPTFLRRDFQAAQAKRRARALLIAELAPSIAFLGAIVALIALFGYVIPLAYGA
jgi:hypothetical protein